MSTALDLPAGERPLDRLYRAGAGALSDAELVSILIGRDVVAARTLVRDGLPAFARAPWDTAKPRVTRTQAARVLASLELNRRLASTTDAREPICDPQTLGRPLVARYAHHVQEVLGAVYLDAKHRVIREREVFIGTINSAVVSTRDVLRFALDDHAAAVVVFHNHPSGCPEPSGEDLLFTRKLVDAGKLLGVDVLDHLILGAGRFVSLKLRGDI
jgi:DNA repair protein RadC